MLKNILVASTNFVGISAVIDYYRRGLIFKSFIIGASIFFSTIYHLVERNKHNMPGITGICEDDKTQTKLLDLDRFFAKANFFVTLHTIYVDQVPLTWPLIVGIIGIIGELVPEVVSGLYSSGRHKTLIPAWVIEKINPTKYKISENLEHIIYLLGHNIWHVCAFEVSNIAARFAR